MIPSIIGVAGNWKFNWLCFGIPNKISENKIEIEKDGLQIHLSEHHGDGTPGASVFVWCDGVEEFHKEIINKKYKYNKPGLAKTSYGSLAVKVIDPFHNQIIFNEKTDDTK